MSMTVTEITLDRLVVGREDVKHEAGATLTLGAAVALKAGTILARDNVTKKFVPFVKGGTTNGNGIPIAVLGYDKDVLAAGDINVDVITGGVLYSDKLIILADGDNSNVDSDVLDVLRSWGIYVEAATDNSKFDNN